MAYIPHVHAHVKLHVCTFGFWGQKAPNIGHRPAPATTARACIKVTLMELKVKMTRTIGCTPHQSESLRHHSRKGKWDKSTPPLPPFPSSP